jgi:hypothetical protein
MLIDEKMFAYDGVSTRSCVYLFKPTSEAQPERIKSDKYYKYEGTLMKSIQVFAKTNNIDFERKIDLFEFSGVPKITTSQKFKGNKRAEISLRYKTQNPARFFSDDSYSSPERRYIDVAEAIARNLT